MEDQFRALPLENPSLEVSGDSLDVADIRNSLQSLMWRAAGVQREGEELRDAAESIDHWWQYVLPRQFSAASGWELQNLITIARATVAAALTREESRGVHLRVDFPQAVERWCRRITVQRGEDGALQVDAAEDQRAAAQP